MSKKNMKPIGIAVNICEKKEVDFYNLFITHLNRYVLQTADYLNKETDEWVLATTVFSNNFKTRFFAWLWHVLFRRNSEKVIMDMDIPESP